VKGQGRVIFLTHDSLETRLIAEAVASVCQLVGIVLEVHTPVGGPGSPGLFGSKMVARRLLGQRLYLWLRTCKAQLERSGLERRVVRVERRLQRSARKDIRNRLGARKLSWPHGVPIYRTPASVNAPACIAWCTALRPDLTAVYGTSILKDPVIRVARLGALNPHTSILPDYRGTRPEFWQALHDDYEKAGVTVHFVDAGVDTGDIVLQRRSHAPPGTDPYAMRIHNALIASALLPMAIRGVLDGTAQRTPQGGTSMPTRRARDITLERRVELLRKLGYECETR
jgi:hypothetical protein